MGIIVMLEAIAMEFWQLLQQEKKDESHDHAEMYDCIEDFGLRPPSPINKRRCYSLDLFATTPAYTTSCETSSREVESSISQCSSRGSQCVQLPNIFNGRNTPVGGSQSVSPAVSELVQSPWINKPGTRPYQELQEQDLIRRLDECSSDANSDSTTVDCTLSLGMPAFSEQPTKDPTPATPMSSPTSYGQTLFPATQLRDSRRNEALSSWIKSNDFRKQCFESNFESIFFQNIGLLHQNRPYTRINSHDLEDESRLTSVQPFVNMEPSTNESLYNIMRPSDEISHGSSFSRQLMHKWNTASTSASNISWLPLNSGGNFMDSKQILALRNYASGNVLRQQKNNINNNTSTVNMRNNLGQKVGRNGQENAGNSNAGRKCSTCETTTTPLWRNGPKGAKSLCNACGIRYKKEERRAAASAMAAGAPSEKQLLVCTKQTKPACSNDVDDADTIEQFSAPFKKLKLQTPKFVPSTAMAI
eukprot:Gb_25568 [translate_table: standard]